MTDETAQGVTGNVIALLFGHPDPTTLLTPEFQASLQAVLANPNAYTALQYGNEQGTPALISCLVEKINREQKLALTSQNVMITAGSTGAVDMLARLYAGPGSVVIVEAPSYADSLHVFRDHRVEMCSVPMDENGLITAELENLLKRLQSDGKSPRLLYTIPNFHNPTGITTTLDRRREVIRLAGQYGFWVVEDDVYRDLSFGESIPPSYYELAGDSQVMSISSFSKTLAPGLRLGWLMAAPEIIQNCVNCGVMQMGGGANPFPAQIVAEYCAAGHWEAHIARLRKIYQKRCQTMLATLDRFMPPGVTWTQPTGGFFIWLYLPESLFAQEVKRAAFERGVSVTAGEGFFANPPDGSHNLRLAFSYASLEDIEKGVQILSEVLKSM